MTEFDEGAANGLPGPLPAGERLLRQGRPDWRVLARTAFHTRLVAGYFHAARDCGRAGAGDHRARRSCRRGAHAGRGRARRGAAPYARLGIGTLDDLHADRSAAGAAHRRRGAQVHQPAARGGRGRRPGAARRRDGRPAAPSRGDAAARLPDPLALCACLARRLATADAARGTRRRDRLRTCREDVLRRTSRRSDRACPASCRSRTPAARCGGGERLRRPARGGTVASVIRPGEKTGFVRGVLRGLARERHQHGIGAGVPFELRLWRDGELSLTARATGRSIEMTAFGPAARAAFALLPEPAA